jgi:vancomycin resistance protein YoaR
VTARQNHSYRVSYYEKDGDGHFIGPGLDATIYSPNPDFKFKNDTGSPLLIIGYVEGDKVTFELYGTSDGRTARVEGPRVLSEFPAGDPIYAETDTLPVGVTKQIEKPHPGGTAVANYYVTYADGHQVSQEFKSYYRRWPARFLVGTAGASPTVSPSPSNSPTPSPL